MSIRCSVLTISDTRTKETDLSGKAILNGLTKENHFISSYEIVPDEVSAIKDAYENFKNSDAQVLITNGGTGIAKRDVTSKALEKEMVEKIPGFGEIFRHLSYLEIGSHAMASKAMAGINDKKQLIFTLPGSTSAVELGMDRLIIPEIPHLIYELFEK